MNVFDMYGSSSFELAITGGLNRVAEVLLKNGAEVNLRTQKGHAVLLYSAERNHTRVVAPIVKGMNSLALPGTETQGTLDLLTFAI